MKKKKEGERERVGEWSGSISEGDKEKRNERGHSSNNGGEKAHFLLRCRDTSVSLFFFFLFFILSFLSDDVLCRNRVKDKNMQQLLNDSSLLSYYYYYFFFLKLLNARKLP